MENTNWARLLAYVTGLVNQELLLQNEYLAAENRILKASLPLGFRLSNGERTTLAEIGGSLYTQSNPFLQTEYRTIANALAPSTTAITTYTYDSNGNVTEADNYDWVNYSILPSGHNPISSLPAGLGSPTRTTKNTYALAADTGSNSANGYWNPSAPSLLNAKTSVLVSEGSPQAYSQYMFDNPTGTGNVTQEYHWDSARSAFPASGLLTSLNSVETVRTYNAQGDVATETDPRGIVKRVFYYAGGGCSAYPTDIFEASGTSDQRHWQITSDCNTGLETALTDADNGATTYKGYDSLGRLTVEIRPNSQQTNIAYSDATQTVTSRSDLNAVSDGLLQTTKTTDDLGSIWQIQETGDSSACPQIATQILQRTGSGNTYKAVSNPFCGTGDPTMGWTLTSSDTMGRDVSVTHYTGSGLPPPFGTANPSSTGSATTSYGASAYGSTYVITDEAGISRTITYDALGRLKSVLDGTSVSTSYGYVLNNLTTVTQSSESRSFRYTSLGRLASATNPENCTVSYAYDLDGNLISRSDARGVVLSANYNNLNQVLQKQYSDGTPTVSYSYSSCGPYSVGQLCSVSNSISSTAYTYGIAGLAVSSTQVIGNSNYQFSYQYNLSDQLTQETYPSGRIVKNAYNSAGRVSAVSGTLNSIPTAYAGSSATPISYTPNHAVQGILFGNGVTETWTYNARLQPTQVQAGSLMTLGFSYSSTQNNGNLTGQTIAGAGLSGTITQSYSFDSLNRLALFQETGGTANQTYSFDVYGNRWISGGWVPYTGQTPQSDVFPNNQWASGSGVSYDAAGNLTAISTPSRSFAYDAENRQTSATINSTTTTYGYDGNGLRISKVVSGGATTNYVYDATGQLAAEYGPLQANSPCAAAGAPPTPATCYLTPDHLGSTRLVSSQSGTAAERYDFAPFGEELPQGMDGRGTPFSNNAYPTASPDALTEKFTSKERDAETGLDFFGARYMSSAQGRWTSPDAINLTDERILNPSNTLNKYIYGGNNPLKYVDPDGRDITVFYTNTGPAGHFWMAASDPGGQQSAILDFGPANGASRMSEALGRDVPGNTNYAAHMPSADEIRQDYTSLTIQTNPVDTQNAINAINSANASLTNYNVYGPNCTTVCRDVLHKILGLDTNSIRPTALWSDIFLKWSKQAMQPRQSTSRGTPAPQVQSAHGVDYGNPRYGMNTFDFVWMLLQQQNQQQPKPQVTSKICYTDENGKQVCQ